MDQVLMAYGSGGSMMHELIDKIFVESYGSDVLRRGDDAAVLSYADAMSALSSSVSDSPRIDAAEKTANRATEGATDETAREAGKDIFRGRLAFTTDSFVVTPHFFPGGDIGRLAVCGTVNDIATSGATPLWISVAFILEEGYSLEQLKKICKSIAVAAKEAGVSIVTGDTKVVERGHGDGIFINTAGIGIINSEYDLGGANCRPGDKILLSGSLGDHGIAITCAREQLNLSTSVESDAAPLNHLISRVLTAAPNTHCFRDPTRGGLASTLNELASQSQTTIFVDEQDVPVKDQVRGVCDILGYDVFQVANEGKIVCAVPANEADAALEAMRNSVYGKDAAIIGEVCGPDTIKDISNAKAGFLPQVYVRTVFGTKRVLDMLVGEQLPRIC